MSSCLLHPKLQGQSDRWRMRVVRQCRKLQVIEQVAASTNMHLKPASSAVVTNSLEIGVGTKLRETAGGLGGDEMGF